MAEPRHRQLSAEFRDRIARGMWPEGGAIPSEAQLCAEFEVSRGPVRQALATLRSEGLLVVSQGRQTRVRQGALSQPVEVFVSFSEWAVSTGSTPGQRTVEIARRHCPERIARELQVAEGDQIVQLLRIRSLDGVPTMVERTNYVLDVGNLLFGFDTDSGSTFRYLMDHGVDLFEARHVIDAVGADQVDAEALGVPEGTPLLRELRTTRDSSGRVLEYAEDRYLPGRANFVIENQMSHGGRLALAGNTETERTTA